MDENILFSAFHLAQLLSFGSRLLKWWTSRRRKWRNLFFSNIGERGGRESSVRREEDGEDEDEEMEAEMGLPFRSRGGRKASEPRNEKRPRRAKSDGESPERG